MDRAVLERWVSDYEKAWASNAASDIGELFTDDARYYTAPFREPWQGRQGIVDGWLGRKDEPGSWTFRWEMLAVTEEVGFVRGWTRYVEGPNYSNLWVISLGADGRCSEFTEWWMEESGRDG